MEKFSIDVLPVEKWEKAKGKLKFYWLKKDELACCHYHEGEDSFMISYDIKTKSLMYYDWSDLDYCTIINLLPRLGAGDIINKDVQQLICQQYLLKQINNIYEGKN